MIPTGISPTEAAFEVIGLVNAKSIIDFLFFETQIGLAVFLIGFLTSLWRSVKETDFSILWSYLMMFCILLFIFIKPMANLENATSTMEAAGWKGTSTQDSLKRTFIDYRKDTSRLFRPCLYKPGLQCHCLWHSKRDNQGYSAEGF